ncbi:hypothetical protein ABZ883_12075 [Streptomyces sp. NPDC046977]|uniref:hypothetical protein n=1 Tax=Streptomyces sp. NPDC046977 TaxID=3154703 RepID=UPI0033E594F0
MSKESNEPGITTIQDRAAARAARIAADLDSNAREQESVRAQIGELQEHLTKLGREHELLTQLRGTEPTGSGAASPRQEVPAPAEEAPAAPVDAVTPKPAKAAKSVKSTKSARTSKAPKAPVTAKAATATGTVAAAEPVAASEPVAAVEPVAAPAVPGPRGGRKKAPVRTATRQRGKNTAGARKPESGPTLVSLLEEILSASQEPRMVSEIVNVLTDRHPDRAAKTQVVRNTLEALVAKGVAERTRQQGSVFYTPVPAGGADANGTAATKAEQAAEPAAATA